MLRRRLALAVLLSAAAFSLASAESHDPGPAHSAAVSWLHAIDAGNYAESWDAAGAYFRGAVAREKWVETLNGVRKPFGDLRQRRMTDATFHSSLPGAPDGEYFILQFETAFAKKASALETVFMVKENDAWKTAGYFIR